MEYLSSALFALLVSLSIFLYSLQALFCKAYSKNFPGTKEMASIVYSVYYCLFIGVATLLLGNLKFTPSWQTVVFGIVNAIAIIAYNVSLVEASTSGSYSIMMICMLFGGVTIPIFEAAIFFDKHLNQFQTIAIIMILVSFVLMNYEKQSKTNSDTGHPVKFRNSKKFYIYCAVLFISNGLYGSLLDAQQRVAGASERFEMIVITYLAASVISFAYLLYKARGGFLRECRLNFKSSMYLSACCILVCIGVNLLMLYILRIRNVPTFFAIENGGVLLVSVICSFLLFHEKVNFYKICGIFLSLISMVMLNIF